MRIVIPQINIWAKRRGVSAVLEVLAPVFSKQKRVVFDFSLCHFISAEAVAILAITKLLRDQEHLHTEIDPATLDPPVKRFLGKSRFLYLFGHDPIPWTDNSLPILVQIKLSKQEILEYIDKEILQRYEMPEMSELLQKQIRRAFFELFGNVFYHSQSPVGGVLCGQVYPNSKKIQIVVSDAGMGIARRVRCAVSEIESDPDAIQWALKRGTSTLSNQNESRGLGLFLLRQFLRVNEGELSIYANNGFVEEISGHRTCGELKCELKGTLIDIRIRVRNDIKYILSSEDK